MRLYIMFLLLTYAAFGTSMLTERRSRINRPSLIYDSQDRPEHEQPLQPYRFLSSYFDKYPVEGQKSVFSNINPMDQSAGNSLVNKARPKAYPTPRKTILQVDPTSKTRLQTDLTSKTRLQTDLTSKTRLQTDLTSKTRLQTVPRPTGNRIIMKRAITFGVTKATDSTNPTPLPTHPRRPTTPVTQPSQTTSTSHERSEITENPNRKIVPQFDINTIGTLESVHWVKAYDLPTQLKGLSCDPQPEQPCLLEPKANFGTMKLTYLSDIDIDDHNSLPPCWELDGDTIDQPGGCRNGRTQVISQQNPIVQVYCMDQRMLTTIIGHVGFEFEFNQRMYRFFYRYIESDFRLNCPDTLVIKNLDTWIHVDCLRRDYELAFSICPSIYNGLRLKVLSTTGGLEAKRLWLRKSSTAPMTNGTVKFLIHVDNRFVDSKIIKVVSKPDVAIFTDYNDNEDEDDIDKLMGSGKEGIPTTPGYATRKCSEDGIWEASNYSLCRREDLIALKNEVQKVKSLNKPTPSDINDIASSLWDIVQDKSVTLHSDSIASVLNVITDLGYLVSGANSTEEQLLVSSKTLYDVINVGNTLLSVNDSIWNGVTKYISESNSTQKDKVNTTNTTSASLAARFLLSLDKIVAHSLNDPEIMSEHDVIVRSHIVIKRAKVNETDDINFHEPSRSTNQTGDDMFTKAFLSSQALSKYKGEVRYAVILYKGIHAKLRTTQKEKSDSENYGSDSNSLPVKQVNSDVLSFTLNQQVQQLSPRLEITFAVDVNARGPVCGYLDDSTESWSDDGCDTEVLSDGLVKCLCNHLTNFAVLFISDGIDIHSKHQRILSYITITGCSISIVSLIIFLLTYRLNWKYVKADGAVLHLHLCVCLILTYIVFMAGSNQVSLEGLCTAVAVGLHFLLLVLFFLMLSEGIRIHMSVSTVFSRTSVLGKLLLLSYGGPSIIVAVTMAATQLEGYRSVNYCWLSVETGTIWTFVGPAVAIILINIFQGIFVLKVMVNTVKIKNMELAEKLKAMTKALLIMTPLLGVSWTFGILALYKDLIVFQYLFCIFNSLQGLFFLIFHCIMSHQMRKGFQALWRRFRNWRDIRSDMSFQTVSTSNRREIALSNFE